MSDKISKIIRIITVAPLNALILVTLLYFFGQDVFPDALHYVLSIVFLTVLPSGAYLVAKVVPHLRAKGHDFERNLAMIFSFFGYVAGFVYSLLAGGGDKEFAVYSTYLISGIIMLALNFCFHYKSSGHACALSGPIAMLALRISPFYLFAYILLIPVYISSLKLKRHTPVQFAVGAVIPIAAMALSLLLALLIY